MKYKPNKDKNTPEFNNYAVQLHDDMPEESEIKNKEIAKPMKSKKTKSIRIISKPLTSSAAALEINKYLAKHQFKIKTCDVLAGVPVAYSINDYIEFIHKNT